MTRRCRESRRFIARTGTGVAVLCVEGLSTSMLVRRRAGVCPCCIFLRGSVQNKEAPRFFSAKGCSVAGSVMDFHGFPERINQTAAWFTIDTIEMHFFLKKRKRHNKVALVVY